MQLDPNAAARCLATCFNQKQELADAFQTALETNSIHIVLCYLIVAREMGWPIQSTVQHLKWQRDIAPPFNVSFISLV